MGLNAKQDFLARSIGWKAPANSSEMAPFASTAAEWDRQLRKLRAELRKCEDT